MALPQLPKQAVVVVNVQSRRGEEAFDQACSKLAAAGIDVLSSHPVTDPDDMRADRPESDCRRSADGHHRRR